MAATKKYQSDGGPIDHKFYDSLYSKTFDDVRIVKDKVEREGKQFFANRNTNLKTYKEGEVLSVLDSPFVSEDTDRIKLVSPLEGYEQSITTVAHRSGFIVTEDSVTMQKNNKLSQMLKGLPNTAIRMEEMAYSSIFNGGFTSETGGDGSYAFANDHYHEDPQHGQWTNVAAAASSFNTVSYMVGYQNLQQRKDAKGYPARMQVDAVYYHVSQHEDVMKVHGSEKYPQNSLNATMMKEFGLFKPVSGVWLHSEDAWFIHAKVDESEKGFIMVWRKKPNYKPISDPMNPDLIMGRRLKMALGVGVIHGRDWFANTGI